MADQTTTATPPTSPTARSQRSRWLLLIAALLTVLVVSTATWYAATGAAGTQGALQAGTNDQPDRVDIHASLVRVDPARDEMLLRMVVTPQGSLGDGGGLTPTQDLEIQTSAAVKTDLSFPAGERMSAVDVVVALDGDGGTSYPFDRYDVVLELAATHGGDRVPVSLSLSSTDALFSIHAEAEEQADVAVASLEVTRSASVLTFALFMIVAMWALALSVATGAWLVLSQRRGVVWPALGWMAATLFAIVGFRNAAPGTPPIGSIIDYLAFFWAEAIITISLVTTVVGSVRMERAALPGGEQATGSSGHGGPAGSKAG